MNIDDTANPVKYNIPNKLIIIGSLHVKSNLSIQFTSVIVDD
jgi:hypothetical protein